MSYDIDIDWNEEDDTGLPWTFIDSAVVPERVVPGAYLVAGRGTAIAVAEVVDVNAEGLGGRVEADEVGGGRSRPVDPEEQDPAVRGDGGECALVRREAVHGSELAIGEGPEMVAESDGLVGDGGDELGGAGSDRSDAAVVA